MGVQVLSKLKQADSLLRVKPLIYKGKVLA
jgi:hypothetical protein